MDIGSAMVLVERPLHSNFWGFSMNPCEQAFSMYLTPPLFALRWCQSQAWIKEEGDANGPFYHAVSLNFNCFNVPSFFSRELFSCALTVLFVLMTSLPN